MGASGQGFELEPIDGVKNAPAAKVLSAAKDMLKAVWKAALPPALAKSAIEWIDLGEDSLLTIEGDRDGDDDGPASSIIYMFYETVEWPQALASHWLQHALMTNRKSFLATLKKLGYTIAEDSWYPTRKEVDEDRFVVDGKRIGHPDDDGVFWQLPEYGFDEYDTLAPKLKERALAIREAKARCECVLCRKPSKRR